MKKKIKSNQGYKEIQIKEDNLMVGAWGDKGTNSTSFLECLGI